jgi:Zn-dependent oligopeptidase
VLDENIWKNKKFKGDKIKVELTRDTYFTLINTIKDADTRKKIEDIYSSRTNSVIPDMCKIIVLRHYYAKELGYDSYFDYVNDNSYNTSDIKDLINDLIDKVDKRMSNEIEKIHVELSKDGYHKKVNSNDIIYCHNKLQNKTLFKPSDVFAVIFKMMDKYFGVKFSYINAKTWGNSVVVFNVLDSKNSKLLGRLFIDIVHNENKKVDSPFFIKLTDRYNLEEDTDVVNMCILGNFRSLNTECMNYNEVVLLFRECGHLLQHTVYRSNMGLINYDKSFSNFLPQIMEYIAWEGETISQIACKHNKDIVDHILYGRNIDICYSIKSRCIYASIDHIIHSSSDFINLVNDTIKKKNSTNNIFIDLYRSVYREMMSNSKDILDIEINAIPPHIVVQMINGSEGILYGNILSEILSYTVFYAIKNGGGIKFKESVLQPTTRSFRELLNSFISTIDTDTYDLYLSEILGFTLEDKDDIVTEDTNYFDDKDSDTDQDIDDIIIIKSKYSNKKSNKKDSQKLSR